MGGCRPSFCGTVRVTLWEEVKGSVLLLQWDCESMSAASQSQNLVKKTSSKSALDITAKPRSALKTWQLVCVRYSLFWSFQYESAHAARKSFKRLLRKHMTDATHDALGFPANSRSKLRYKTLRRSLCHFGHAMIFSVHVNNSKATRAASVFTRLPLELAG